MGSTPQEKIEGLLEEISEFEGDSLERLDGFFARAGVCVRKGLGEGHPLLSRVQEVKERRFAGVVTSEKIRRDRLRKAGSLGEVLKAALEEMSINESEATDTTGDTGNSRKVFVVHGHDHGLKEEVARVLEKLNLEPIILHELPDQGRTIIEKFEASSEVRHAVVLLTPDDIAIVGEGEGSNLRPDDVAAMLEHEKEPDGVELTTRARQNVLIELGYFLGALGRDGVSVLYKTDEGFEMPSDYLGVLYTEVDSAGAWRLQMAKEMKAAGIKIDLNLLA